MKKAANRKAIKQRSVWIASMFGCAAFLLMAVKIYNVSVSSLLGNLGTILILLAVIVAAAAGLVRLKYIIRKHK